MTGTERDRERGAYTFKIFNVIVKKKEQKIKYHVLYESTYTRDLLIALAIIFQCETQNRSVKILSLTLQN